MIKFFKIFFCLLSVLTIVLVEDPELSSELEGLAVYGYMILALLSVIFLQNQLYRYLLPKSLRDRSLDSQHTHYNNSFFKGTIGLGYFLVVLHLFAFYMSADMTNKPQGFLYIGSTLIFFGTLSKIKGIIATELNF